VYTHPKRPFVSENYTRLVGETSVATGSIPDGSRTGEDKPATSDGAERKLKLPIASFFGGADQRKVKGMSGELYMQELREYNRPFRQKAD
jgi:hypothetical protein